MKCPKCGYIGFESAEKCRNCGYDFSLLADPVRDLDLPLRTDEPLEAPADFDLRTDGADDALAPPHRTPDKDAFKLPSLPPRVPPPELPLFAPPPADAASPPPPRDRSRLVAVTPAAAPARRPAAPPTPARPAPTPIPVRAAASFQPRSGRVVSLSLKEAELGLELEPPPPRMPTPRSIGAGQPGGPVARAIAGVLDVSILLGLDAAVLYFTLRLCRLSFGEIGIVPIAPLVAFFALLDGAYLIAFTAVGGQTIGKMATSLKVVGEDGTPVLPGQAIVRAAGYVASMLPAGLGFVPGFFGPSRRTLHDRLANTRVVQV